MHRFIYAFLLSAAFLNTIDARQNIIPPQNPPLNVYNLLLTVGTDEPLTQSAVHVGTQGFVDYLGWNQDQIDAFQAAAVSWFEERFGVDFTGAINVGNNIIVGSNFNVAPIYFDGNYRVLSSNNNAINDNPNQPSTVRLAEFVLSWNPSTSVTYDGTYGPNIAGDDSDTLAFGCYVVTSRNGYGPQTKYNFFMRSYYPNHSIPGTSNPTRSNENFQMYSPVWGSGYGFLNVAVPTTPVNGSYPTYTRASWSFPGSFTQTDFNGWTVSPI